MLLFLLGILGILQSTFLPGALITLWWVREERLSLFFPISFGLSLLANYLLVISLVLMNLYNQQIMLLIIIFEFVVFFICYRAGRLNFINMYNKKFKYYFINYKELFDFKYIPHFIISIFFLYSCYSMFIYVGNVFTGWDAVNAWNRWSIEWSKGHFANYTGYYPQLLPISQSICYVLMGRTDIEFFSYITNLFYQPLSILAIFVLLNKNKLILPALSLAFIIILTRSYYFDSNHIGFGDIPIMTLSSISVTLLLYSLICKDNSRIKYILFSVIFAACAAITKRSGLLLFIFIPLIAYEFGLLSKYKREFWLCCFFTLLIIVSSWYIHIWSDTHNFYFIIHNYHHHYKYTSTHTYLYQRLLLAIHNYPFLFYLTLLSIPALFSKNFKFVAVSGISGYLIWSSFYSYDMRNIAVAIPFLGLAIGVSVPLFIHFLGKFIYKSSCYLSNLLHYLIEQINFLYNKFNLISHITKIKHYNYNILILYKSLRKRFTFKHIVFLSLLLTTIILFILNNKVNNMLISRQNNLNIKKCNNMFLNSILLYTSTQSDDVFYGNYPSLCVPFLPEYYPIQYDAYIENIPVHKHFFLLLKDNPSKSCPNEIKLHRKCSVLISENGYNLLHIE